MRLIGYARVSTGKQEDKYSLPVQAEKIQQYADLHDHQILDIISETGSAKTVERDGLRKVLDTLKSGAADGVIIMKLDRLTRSVFDFHFLLREVFEKHNFELISVTDHFDTSSANGRLATNVLLSVIEWERETIAERTSSAMAEMKRQGKLTGSAPYGFSVIRTGQGSDGEEEVRIVPDETEMRVVKIVQRFSDKTNGWIIDKLNRMGYQNRAGNSFTWKTIQGIRIRLDDPEYEPFEQIRNPTPTPETSG